MIGQLVRIDESGELGQEYRITRLLGSGFLGAVYEAEAVAAFADAAVLAPTPHKIAVKSPHAQLGGELHRRFWQEYEALKRIRSGAEIRSHVPAVWRGRRTSTGDAATGDVLCMELVQGNELTNYFEEGRDVNGRTYYGLPEQLALAIGEQYAELVMALEKAAISCADRKVHDLYWDHETSRLTVLDWNVVEMASAPGVVAGSTISRTNIAVFGRLWFELLTGALPPLPDERNRRPFGSVPAWKSLSQGTRAIVEKALAGAGFADAHALQTAVSTHRRDFDRLASVSEFRTLAYSAESAVKNLTDQRNSLLARLGGLMSASSGSSADLLRELQALLNDYKQKLANAERLVDLVEIKANQGYADAKQYATRLRPSLQQGSKFVEREAIKQLLEHQLEMRNYPQAGQSAQVLGELFKSVGDYSNQLYVARWETVAKAGAVGLENSPAVYLSNYMTDLVALLGAMERQEWATAQAQWATFAERIRAISERVRTPLAWLGDEIGVWLALQRAVVAERTGIDAQVVAKVKEARAPIDDFPTPYRDALDRVIDQSDWKERVAAAAARSDLGAQLAVDNPNTTFWSEIDEYVENGRFVEAGAKFLLWRDRERELGGTQITQETRRRFDDTERLLHILTSINEAFRNHNWEVLLAPENSLLEQARRLLEQAAGSESCRSALRRELIGVLTQLTQKVEGLAPAKSPARPFDLWRGTPVGVTTAVSIDPSEQAKVWGFVVRPSQAEELLGWVRPLHLWQNSSPADADRKRVWIRDLFDTGNPELGERFWQAGLHFAALSTRQEEILSIRKEYEDARVSANPNTKPIVDRAEKSNIELVDGEAASVTRHKQEWIDFLNTLRSEDIEKSARVLSQRDQQLQRMVADWREIEQARLTIEKTQVDMREIKRYQQELPSLEKAVSDALLSFELAQAQQLLAAIDHMSIKDFLDSADSYHTRVADLLGRVQQRLPQADSVMVGELNDLQRRLDDAKRQHGALKNLGDNMHRMLIEFDRNVDTSLSYPPDRVEPAQQALKRLDAGSRPACAQRLLNKLEAHHSKAVLDQFQEEVQRWWQSWSELGRRVPSREESGASRQRSSQGAAPKQQLLRAPAADLDGLKSAVEDYQRKNLLALPGVERSIASEIVWAWMQRIEAAKALDARLKAIHEYAHLYKPESWWHAKQDKGGVIAEAVARLSDFAPEVLWLKQSSIKEFDTLVPSEIDRKIERGEQLVRDRLDSTGTQVVGPYVTGTSLNALNRQTTSSSYSARNQTRTG